MCKKTELLQGSSICLRYLKHYNSKMEKNIKSLLVCLVTGLQMLRAQTPVKPNVLLIYTDDVGYGDVSYHGGKVPTPNLDKLAAEGLDFTDMHTTSATCTPSRFGLLTGEYPWRYSGTGIASPTKPLIIDTSWYTLPDMMKDGGYKTAVIGKWHLGIGGNGGADYTGIVRPGPLDLGFDECFIIPSTGDRVPSVYVHQDTVFNRDPNDPITIGGREVLKIPGVTQYPVLKDSAEAAYVYPSSTGHNNSVINGVGRIGYMAGGKQALWSDENMADDLVTRAEQFIGENKDIPFFLFFSTHDIHVPRVPHPRFRITEQGWRGDAMVQLDWCVGALRKSLEDNGLDQNTIIIFSSDNGPVLGDGYKDSASANLNGHDASGVFAGGKYNIKEAGTRVPCIIWWPGVIEPGESHALMSQIDFLSSFAAFLGVDVPANSAKDSENHMAALLGQTEQGKEVLIEDTRKNHGIRIDDWKLVYNKKTDATQLYDLLNDTTETTNIVAQNTDIKDSLLAVRQSIIDRTYEPPDPIDFTIPTTKILEQRQFNESIHINNTQKGGTFVVKMPSIKNSNAYVKINLFDMQGRTIKSIISDLQVTSISLRDVSKGIYLYQVHIGNQKINGKFLISF